MTELKALSQRIVVAKMLSDKQVYSEIVSKTGASTATISRVNRSLNYGCDGYEKIFERIDAAEAEKKTDMSDYSFFARFYDGLTQMLITREEQSIFLLFCFHMGSRAERCLISPAARVL